MTPKCKNILLAPENRRAVARLLKSDPPAADVKSSIPSHHWFHYTDVPLADAEKYAAGKVGRSQWDIVHMMCYCIAVLRDEVPENNERKITKPIALIPLAHFVGDIHQALHVGAQYFDARGNPVNPERVSETVPDERGKFAAAQARRHRAPKTGSRAPRFLG